MEEHEERVRDIATQVKSFYDKKEKFRINRGATNSSRDISQKGKNFVYTGNLNHVLKVDTEKMVVHAEANVPLDRLVEATLAHNCVPPVVMEFPGITVGGGFSGTSGEASSYKHGFFDRTVVGAEIVLPNGEVLHCSETEHVDLFRGAAGAMGTLGVVTKVEVKLEKATKYVETTYHQVSSLAESVEKTKEFTSGVNYDEYDYVDGIMFSSTSGATITGRRTNEEKPGIPVARFSAASDPWYYLHVEDRIRNAKEPVTDLIPLPEYLFRFDRGAFWIGRNCFDPPVSNIYRFNSFTRWLCDDFMHTRLMYAMGNTMSKLGIVNTQIVHDLALPMDTATEFLERTAKTSEIWPLWLCPLKPSSRPNMTPSRPEMGSDLLLNIGIWGPPSDPSLETFFLENQVIEDNLQDLGGVKWGYSPHFESEDEFWSMFDRDFYEGLRKKYHATGLPNMYEKAHEDPEKLRGKRESITLWNVWPFVVFGTANYLFFKAWQSGEVRHKRESTWPNWVPRK